MINEYESMARGLFDSKEIREVLIAFGQKLDELESDDPELKEDVDNHTGEIESLKEKISELENEIERLKE